MPNDQMFGEILDDGTVKSWTDKISGPNHTSAEKVLSGIAKLTGGNTTREAKKDSKQHHHHHDHVGERSAE